jgi:hypothetical protein
MLPQDKQAQWGNTMTEFIFKRSDFSHTDPAADRQGVHKRTDIINYKPDGWSDSPNWAASSYPRDFVVVKVPGITFKQAAAAGYHLPWRDVFDYEILTTRPDQGEFDLRIFEKNSGAIYQNAIAGIKATRIRNYLSAWGCSAFSLSATDASFTFSLWDAVRSSNFWGVQGSQLAQMSFGLKSYSGATGIGTITVTADAATKADVITRRIESRGGTVTLADHPGYTFTVERSDILTRFKSDIRERLEQVYLRHRYCISIADHDAIVAAGGMVTISKAAFLGKIVDKLETI